jgi:hypothetical protein
MRSAALTMMVFLASAAAVNAAEFGSVTGDAEFRKLQTDVRIQVRDLNKDSRGSDVKWKGFLAHCDCKSSGGKICYGYDVISGSASATTLINHVRDFAAKECDGCSKQPKIMVLNSYASEYKPAVQKKTDEGSTEKDRFFQGSGYTAVRGGRGALRPVIPRRWAY